MVVHLAPVALLLFLSLSLPAQENQLWAGWHDASSVAGEVPVVVEGGVARVDLRPGSERTLTCGESFADGRIRLEWRASDGCELWLELRGADRSSSTRIRLASSLPAGAVFGPRDERSDVVAQRWHEAEVTARGAAIEVRIDGREAVSRAFDPRSLSGQVSLAMRRVPESGPGHVELREPVIQRAGAHRWRTILDGSKPIDAERWERVPGGDWRVEGGAVIGSCEKSEPRHGILLSTFEVDDFAARLVYRAVQGNSGLYFRCERVTSAVGVHGFQAEIDATRDAGMLYETGGRARVQLPTKESVDEAFRPGEWNEMLVVAQGRRVEVYVNGHRMTRLVDDPGRLHGRLGLQLHGGQDMRVEVRELQLLEPVEEQR